MVKKREVVLDTETTGFKWDNGDRVFEVGCVEIVNYVPTGKTFHKYINPERDIPEISTEITGIKAEDLIGKPLFRDIAEELLDFIGDSKFIAHNAQFDFNFLNMELKRAGAKLLETHQMIDTLEIARKKYPGARNSLDALCARFDIDNSHRTFHGALLDSEILAEVYLELMGGKEPGLSLGDNKKNKANISDDKNSDLKIEKKEFREARKFEVSTEELNAHKKFVANINDNLWGIEKNKDEE